jgi:gluconolactonase
VQGRANGIEISNDEKHLYASETWANDMKIYKNVVWKYDIDQNTGHISNKRLHFDMKEIDEELQGKAGDIDGVRTDMAGNLYLVRNGEPGEVVKVSPEGKIMTRIKLEGIIEPTNIELGGPHGTTLFIVGKCRADVNKACIDTWENYDAPGRAFFNLYRPKTYVSSKYHDAKNHEDL